MIYRLEPATGLLNKGLAINGEYLRVYECTIKTEQKIEQKWLIQGGPYSGIAFFGMKYIKGTITFPLRVTPDDHLELAAQYLLENSARPFASLRIDTNHAVSNTPLTDQQHTPTDNNQLLSFDCCLVEKLTLTATNNPDAPIKVTADIIGTIDTRDLSNVVVPSNGTLLGRALTWADCSASNIFSAMRSTIGFTLECSCETKPLAFLLPGDTGSEQRNDQAQAIISYNPKWTGNYEEIVRLGTEQNTYIHGGWMIEGNLAFNIGPITAMMQNPLFKPADQPLTAKLIKRKVEFMAHMNPTIHQPGLFSFF